MKLHGISLQKFGKHLRRWNCFQEFEKLIINILLALLLKISKIWRVISPHFPQNVWPSKVFKICKRTKIRSVSFPKFSGIGSWDKANRAHFRVYFNPSAKCFTFPTYDVDNKANQKTMKLTKIFRGKGQSDPQENGVIWP